jgi:hypothetical protein
MPPLRAQVAFSFSIACSLLNSFGQVLKNATLQAQAAAAADKDKKGPLAAEPSPRKVSLLPVLPGKDLINDMRNSVYLPRQRDFTSMRQERKAVEKAVNDGKVRDERGSD